MKFLRSGYSTGTCAAASAKAATLCLMGKTVPTTVTVCLPDGESIALSVIHVERGEDFALAAVRKSAGDDPDITDGAKIFAKVEWAKNEGICFVAGEGVGVVTKSGLSVPPGEPAINPVPRTMIAQAVREITHRGVKVTVFIPGGKELAKKTMNDKLGIVGGLSILGTSGRVRPYSCDALRETFRAHLSVQIASGVTAPIFVPGNIGKKAAKTLFPNATEQIVEVGNEWGYMLDHAVGYPLQSLTVLGHPGKLAKLAFGQWNTHSKKSDSAIPYLQALAQNLLQRSLPESTTVEGLFNALPPADRITIGNATAKNISTTVTARIKNKFPVTIILIDMKAQVIGRCIST